VSGPFGSAPDGRRRRTQPPLPPEQRAPRRVVPPRPPRGGPNGGWSEAPGREPRQAPPPAPRLPARPRHRARDGGTPDDSPTDILHLGPAGSLHAQPAPRHRTPPRSPGRHSAGDPDDGYEDSHAAYADPRGAGYRDENHHRHEIDDRADDYDDDRDGDLFDDYADDDYADRYDDDDYDYDGYDYDDYDYDDDGAEHGDDDSGRDGGNRRRVGKRIFGWAAALAVIVLLAGGAYFGARELLGIGYDDYEGTGEADVLIEVSDGDSTNAIAMTLQEADVVASAEAFVEASEGNPDIRSVQPGYYVLKTRMSGASAVDLLVAPESRVGELQLRPGTQLDDIKQPDGSITEGVFTQLSKASCAELNGRSTCVPVEELREVAATADLTELGVPEWAAESAAKAEGVRKLEGLIAPGVYDVRPGVDATQLLTSVLESSAIQLQAMGLPDAAADTGHTPYEILIIASLIEREAVKQDFEKVSRVIYNRLAENMRLEFDSTVNYVLDRPLVRTSDEDRARAGAYNSYQNYGLPPTPISSPSEEAVDAAMEPAQGSWLFFVKCEKNGLSCFAETYEEHQQNAREARARGAY
jgi:UPF0755 protein